MFVPFEELDSQSRIWIYQANRELTQPEQKIIRDAVRALCDQWSAHGNPLRTSFRIDHNYFLVLAVDEVFKGVSGCSIDGSVELLKTIQNQLKIDFFDRSQVAFWREEKVKLIPLKELKTTFAAGILTPSSLAFNTLVATKGDWQKYGISQAANCWLAKYLPDAAVVQ